MPQFHDAYTPVAYQQVAFAAAGGASAASSAFGAQTRYIAISAPGAFTATGGYRVDIGTAPTASATTMFCPYNWVQVFKVVPGSKIAVLSNDTVTGNLSITELC